MRFIISLIQQVRCSRPFRGAASLQSELLLNLLDQPRSDLFAAVIGKYCCLAVKSYPEVTTFGRLEFRALIPDP
jgi:hypothetical protein